MTFIQILGFYQYSDYWEAAQKSSVVDCRESTIRINTAHK